MSNNTNKENNEEDDSSFQLVKSKSKYSKYSKKLPINFRKDYLIDCIRSEADLGITIKKINDSIGELRKSDFCRVILATLNDITTKPIRNIVCFGIGRFADCVVARHQLALLLTIKAKYSDVQHTVFHEPLLNRCEKDILQELKCVVFEQNVEGKYSIDHLDQTIVYLPHCPKQLTNNLLWKNWNAQLSNLILICNSFQSLIESTPQRFLQTDANYLLKISPHCIEIPLKNTFSPSNRFNNTSVHTFDTTELAEDFWKQNPEPVYIEDNELITTEIISSLKLS